MSWCRQAITARLLVPLGLGGGIALFNSTQPQHFTLFQEFDILLGFLFSYKVTLHWWSQIHEPRLILPLQAFLLPWVMCGNEIQSPICNRQQRSWGSLPPCLLSKDWTMLWEIARKLAVLKKIRAPQVQHLTGKLLHSTCNGLFWPLNFLNMQSGMISAIYDTVKPKASFDRDERPIRPIVAALPDFDEERKERLLQEKRRNWDLLAFGMQAFSLNWR